MSESETQNWTRLVRVAPRGRAEQASTAGRTLMEMLVCVAIVAILCAIALPSMAKAWQSYHLGSAASSLSGAIQSTRYQAIFYGCSYQLAISATSYQISSEVLSGTPPTCASTYTNVGSAVPFSQGDVSVGTAVTLTFNANGTVSTSATSSTNLAISTIVVGFTVPGQTAQRTITVSGVGYVTIS